MKLNITQYTKGLLLILLIGLTAHFLAPVIPGMNGVLLGLILGLIIGNTLKVPTSFFAGINFSSSSILELAIILLAFGINFNQIQTIGFSSMVIISTTIATLLLVTLFISRRIKCPGSAGVLIGFGTAICGSSAIAALAPSVTENKEDIGISMAVVNLIGGIGMLALPLIIPYFNMSDMNSGILIGGSLHSVGNAAGAGYAISEEVGVFALTVKMVRVAMLAPAVLLFNYLINFNKPKGIKNQFKLPGYLIAFIAVTVFIFFIDIPSEILIVLDFLAKITLTMAMTAIGIKISFNKLYSSGRKAIGFGFIIFGIQLFILSVLIFSLSK